MTSRRLTLAIGVLSLVGVAAVLTAQTPARPVLPPGTPLEEILAEVKGMRADMAQSSSATIRTQLLVARLQLQEQRINNVVAQLAESRTQLSGVRQEIAAMDSTLRQLSERMQQLALSSTNPERAEVEREVKERLADMQRNLAPRRQRELELVTRESELTGLFAQEQARWSEFNDRLDALERSLPAR